MTVAGIAGIGQQHPIVRVDQQRGRQLQGAGSAGRDQNPSSGYLDAVTNPIVFADGAAQLRQSGGGGVAGATLRQRALAGGDDRGGGRKVRLADFHVDDRAARRFQFLGAGQQGHHVKRRDVRHPAGQRAKPNGHNIRPRLVSSSRMVRSIGLELTDAPPAPEPSDSRICKPTLFLESAFLIASSREILPSLYNRNSD